MKILFCGDVVGKEGRNAISNHIRPLRAKLNLDCVVVNGENSAGGFGLNKKICDRFHDRGVDVITGGDHCFDQKEILDIIDHYPTLIRPANWSDKLPGKGTYIYETEGNQKVLVMHLLGQVFMKVTSDYNPFIYADKILQEYKLHRDVDAIIVDFHAEATAEAMAMGHYLDGRVSLVTGTHTHVPTADIQILPAGTAYQSDAGMCGDYDSVIGFNKKVSLEGFLNKIQSEKLTPAMGEPTLCGIYVETKYGLATRVEPVRVGGRLSQHIPTPSE